MRTTTDGLKMLAVATLAGAFDLVTKDIAQAELREPVGIGWLNLTLSENRGVAFGIGEGTPPSALVVITGAVIVALLVLSLRGGLNWFGSGLIAGGAAGNLIDRILDGGVTDFIDVGWWPSFNIADIAIVLGVAAVLIPPCSSPRMPPYRSSDCSRPRRSAHSEGSGPLASPVPPRSDLMCAGLAFAPDRIPQS